MIEGRACALLSLARGTVEVVPSVRLSPLAHPPLHRRQRRWHRRRVDGQRVAAHTGPLGRADAGFVKARTGFSIGGEAPLAYATPTPTLIDRELFRFGEIWAAAGHPNGVFCLSPDDLVRLTSAPVADVVQTP
jgi:hypothetical protein